MTRIVLVRHGESEGNAARVLQGRIDLPLSEEGIAQAKALAARLAATPPAALYCSGLARALATAAALGDAWQMQVTSRADLAEMDMGSWEGLGLDDFRARHLAQWIRMVEGVEERPHGGETPTELRTRVVAALLDIVARHPGETVVVVTHGGVIQAAVNALFDLPLRRGGPIGPTVNTARTELLFPDPVDADEAGGGGAPTDPFATYAPGGRMPRPPAGAAPRELPATLVRFNDALHLSPEHWRHIWYAPSPTTFVDFVRHAETEANVAGAWYGHSETSLTARGLEQAAASARTHFTDAQRARIYASDLERTMRTADPIARILGHVPDPRRDLREMHMGAWETLSTADIRETDDESFRRIYELAEDLPRGGEGESWADVETRVGAFLGEMHRAHTGDHVVAVSHGAAIRAAIGSLFSLGHARRDALGGVANASVSTVAVHDAGRAMLSFNLPVEPDGLPI